MSNISNFSSPLRYPGGKSRISNFIEDIIILNGLEGCVLYELFAGGAGVSLKILFSGLCEKIVLNDLDYHLYSFWYSILNDTENFIAKTIDTVVNLDTWEVQKNIYNNPNDYNINEVGFSTFFLNRTNRSGILYKAGPIGGKNQSGNYKIDVRFNKEKLVKRIKKIALYKAKIKIHNKESIDLLTECFNTNEQKLIFLDPPYYKQGESLYLNFYRDNDHVSLSNILSKNKNDHWVLTYDNCERIHDLYSNFRKSSLPMTYTLQKKKKSKEVIIFSDNLILPKNMRIGSSNRIFSLI